MIVDGKPPKKTEISKSSYHPKWHTEMRFLCAIHQNPISNIHIIQPWISLMYQRPNQFWFIWSVILLDRLKNSFFMLFGAFMIKAEMCELLLSLLKVFWSIKVGHKQHLCEIMKPWCGRDFAASKLSNLRILIKYKLLSERQIYTKFSWSSCCASLTFENCKTLPHFMHSSVSLRRVEKHFVANFSLYMKFI